MSLITPTLQTGRLLLRPFTTADTDSVYAIASNPRVMRYWDAPAWTERAQAENFIARCSKMAQDGAGVRLAVTSAPGDELYGWCTLFKWDPAFRSAELGYCYAEVTWGKGIATDAARAVLTWAYNTLDLNRVHGQVDTRNTGSERVLGKLGFKREGTLREDCIVNGEVSDSSVFGLLRREWEART
jgi:[ribosomal protein S5]-alanine N-acetyltransferase